MGESFQDYSRIQDLILKILNKADSYGLFDLISVYLKTIDHLSL